MNTKWPPCHILNDQFSCGAAEFSIWTREAGAGGLSIAVEGPSKAEIAFEDRKDGSSGVSYIVQEPGKMFVSKDQCINWYLKKLIDSLRNILPRTKVSLNMNANTTTTTYNGSHFYLYHTNMQSVKLRAF